MGHPSATKRLKNIECRYRKERQKNVLATAGPHRCVVVLDGLKPGFNVAKIFRSAEALGIAEVQLVDIGVFDPAPARGGFRKVPARFLPTFDASYRNLTERGYTLFRLDATGGNSLLSTPLPPLSAFIFGHEERGFSFNAADYPAIETLSIPQFGTVESLNVSIAASIVLYEYVRQHHGQ